MTPRITLISAGTTKALRAATFGGDGPLDDIGRRQAQALAGSLAGADQCWIAPSQSARETAEALGLKGNVDDSLRDCDFGRWKGLTFKQLVLKEPLKLASWISNPGLAPHGGETVEDVIARVGGWLALRGPAKGHTVAITHPAVIRAAIVKVIEAGPQSFWRIDVVPLGAADLRSNGKRWVLRSLGPLAGGDGPGSAEAQAAAF
jgi:broad specificity phosphatase PhoE